MNTEWLKENEGIILVQEPVLLDDELRSRLTRWCEWATEHYEELKR